MKPPNGRNGRILLSGAAATMHAMPVDWTDDPAAFVGRDWTSLVQADPHGSVFHTPRYLKLYWGEFGSGRLQLAFVKDGHETGAAAAFELAEGTVTFLGGFEI